MTLMTNAMRAVCIAAIGVLGGCERNGAVSSATTTTSTVILSNDTAMGEIATARCTRETACSNVGDKRMWETMYACLRDQRDIARDAIAIQRCPHGIDASALSDCMGAIEREACTAPSLPSACTKTYLCL